MQVARDTIATTGKPILILKSGKTTAGASAAASHTGSLAGSDEICDAAFRQAGIIRCANIEEMFNIAIAFAYQPLPKSNKVAIITNAGGPGVLTTDAAVKEGLELAAFSEETTALFKKNLPATANIKNPVDIIGDARADRYNIAINGAINDPAVDGIFVILTPQSMTDIDTIAHEIVQVTTGYQKPVYASFMGEADVHSGVDILQRNKIPHYILPESMCLSFSRVLNFHGNNHQIRQPFTFDPGNSPAAKLGIRKALEQNKKYLAGDEVEKILEAYALPVIPGSLCITEQEAVESARRIGFPVVMKVMSEDILHKFDVQGVVLNITDDKSAAASFHSIMDNVRTARPGAAIRGIYVSKMIPAGVEVILGFKRDPAFGGVILFGMGGIFVELYRDVSFRIAPLTEADAESMIREIKAFRLLDGMRGMKKSDVSSIKSCILRLSQLTLDFPQIAELDINPLIVHEKGKGCWVADAKILLE